MSRYHGNRRLFAGGIGNDTATHDFPAAEMGVKLGGFMLSWGFGSKEAPGRASSLDLSHRHDNDKKWWADPHS